MKRRKYEYRYRDSGGCTRISIEAFQKHLGKVGQPLSVRAYCYRGAYNNRIAVLVRGDKGTARFGGLCWGYNGKGPSGLRQLFRLLRIPQPIAVFVVHQIPNPNGTTPRPYWCLELKDDGGYNLYLYTKEGKVKEHRRFWLESETFTYPQQLRLAL